MIEVSGLTKRYGEVHALNDVSFKVEKGQIVGFLGANGAGKTTTMDIICGCAGADSGSVKIAGLDVTENPLEAKRRIGYLPDIAPLHTEMRVAEYVSYVGKLHGLKGKELRGRVDETLSELALTDVAKRLVGNLSKGFRQRVALAQAIVHDPDVLILDEPTEGLDPGQLMHIRQLIRSLGGRHTVMFSSHILSEVESICDHILIIHGGRIIESGTYEELTDRLQAGRTYSLRVAERAEGIAAELLSRATVKSATKIDDTHVEFSLRSGDNEAALDDVARQVLDGGYGLREIALKTRRLEDVFLQLTH